MALLEGYQRFTFTRGQFGHERVLTATITGNNPVNGVDEAMHEELARVFTELQQDKGSDIIVLTGAGRAFCAGGDFDWFE
jgi:enoyl-CoA hydratase